MLFKDFKNEFNFVSQHGYATKNRGVRICFRYYKLKEILKVICV